jgi:DNA-directed RNA polymerase
MAIIWKTPSGLILEQRYVDFIREDIKTNILGRSKTISLRKGLKDEIKKKKSKGIVPNLINSLDASNISILVNKMIEDHYCINLLTINDCFASNANHIEDLSYRIKLAFLVIYGDKGYLDSFHKYILEFLLNKGFVLTESRDHIIIQSPKGNSLRRKIPTPPNPGVLDIRKELILSSYFVH